jgi:hypothetical protein
MRDLHNNISAAISVAPAVRTATVNGSGVDLQGYEAAEAIVHFGAYTDGTHTPKLQESDDNSTWSDVAAGDQLGSFSAVSSGGGANTIQAVGYKGAKRYIRVVLTLAGTTTGAGSEALVVRGRKRHIGTTA